MKPEEFRHELNDLHRRLAILGARGGTANEFLQELQTAGEELRVADEELRQQNEALAAACEAAEAERRRYQDLFDFAPDAYLVTDAEGTIREANQAAARLFNVPTDFLLGKPLIVFVAEAQRSEFRAQLGDVVRRGSRQGWDLLLCPRAGQPFDAAATVAVTRGDGRRSLGLRWSLRDITPRKRAEQELRTLNAELEQRVQARTAELAEADRRKDQFLATLAHELRNPLAPVRNALELLELPGADAETRAWARQMLRRQVGHMTRLIDDLLDLTRVGRGLIQLHRESVELATLVRRAVENVQPLVDARRHRLTVALPPEPLRLHADPTRLEQVLSNLLINAAKYTEPGGRIEVSAVAEGDTAVVRVRDTGIGIAADFLPRIFDVFAQGVPSSGQSQGGLGIGLTLVRRLVELHGGTVEAHSEGVGRGSELIVRLPRTAADTESAAMPTNRPAQEPGARLRRVLVVEDDPDCAESLKELLRLWGHDVVLAHNGAEALRAAAEHRPEIVLVDLGLPGMDGYEVARRLRAEVGLVQVPLIALTGYVRAGDQQRSEEAGFREHLAKPVDPDYLRRFLDNLD
jgi:PAS domain S-box-containing protein